MKHLLLLNITMNDNNQERMAFSYYESKILRSFIFMLSLHYVCEINTQRQKDISQSTIHIFQFQNYSLDLDKMLCLQSHLFNIRS